MPLFLLAIPIAVAAAAPAATVSAGVIIGGTAGATGIASWGIWSFFRKKKPTLSPDHQQLLQKQQERTEQRINETRQVVAATVQQSKKMVNDIRTAATSCETTSTQIDALSTSLSSTSNQLKDVTTASKTTCDKLVSSLPDLKRLSDKTTEESLKTVEKLQGFKEQLQLKEQALAQATNGVHTLNATLNEQKNSITTLHGVIKALTTENEEQKATIQQLTQKMKELENEAKLASQNCQFFKKIATQAMSKQPSNPEQIAPST